MTCPNAAYLAESIIPIAAKSAPMARKAFQNCISLIRAASPRINRNTVPSTTTIMPKGSIPTGLLENKAPACLETSVMNHRLSPRCFFVTRCSKKQSTIVGRVARERPEKRPPATAESSKPPTLTRISASSRPAASTAVMK